jgi:hypothetical protein
MLAMLALSFKPNRDELQDMDDQDHPDRPTRH